MGHGPTSARSWASRAFVVVLLGAALGVPALGAAGCGGTDEVERRAEDVERRARAQIERARDRVRTLRERVRRALDDLEQAVPEASRRPPTSRGQDAPGTIGAFLTEIITSVDRYWSTTLRAAGRPEPRVGFVSVDPGRPQRTGCRVVADDMAAFYCTGDDTIYVAERFATELLEGLRDDLPGTRAGYGRAVGDFGVAYVVAHEYAHNLQHEFDLYALRPNVGAAPFELQADCLAGVWGNAVYREGRFDRGDVQEAIATAQAVGDFDYTGPEHHGTPEQRRQAWELGFRTGEPARCQRYLPVA